MQSRDVLTSDEILQARARLPQHVVHRAFVRETVVLNLQTGKYHGLNPTAGRMLEVLNGADSVRSAAVELADAYGQPAEEIERDLCQFCLDLLDRELIVLQTP